MLLTPQNTTAWWFLVLSFTTATTGSQGLHQVLPLFIQCASFQCCALYSSHLCFHSSAKPCSATLYAVLAQAREQLPVNLYRIYHVFFNTYLFHDAYKQLPSKISRARGSWLTAAVGGNKNWPTLFALFLSNSCLPLTWLLYHSTVTSSRLTELC